MLVASAALPEREQRGAHGLPCASLVPVLGARRRQHGGPKAGGLGALERRRAGMGRSLDAAQEAAAATSATQRPPPPAMASSRLRCRLAGITRDPAPEPTGQDGRLAPATGAGHQFMAQSTGRVVFTSIFYFYMVDLIDQMASLQKVVNEAKAGISHDVTMSE